MTPRPPPAWPDTCYIRPIQPETGGKRAWTHLAEVRPPEGKSCRAYIKHYPAQAARGLFNEWFGYTLMQALGVPQPPAALTFMKLGDAPDDERNSRVEVLG